MQFAKLRLAGFKSFVEPTELVIEPGLTGIVGPNGCGKSNLVEALRWVMGETSARQMRGGEMDDVIFNGTLGRPARNLAEVSLLIDNQDRKAPAALNDQIEIEVVRRIERGSGSAYRVNGREVRARDVQLLFADAASGAHSPALVSQGRIGAIINAKPSDRRALLEEAAGITGLRSRRHEAELKLKAAEANLARLDDVLITLDAQLQGLKRQARQAARYRSISDRIRKAEALVLHLRWIEAGVAVETAEEGLRAAEVRVAEITGQAAAASTEQAESAASLPPLRQAEAEAASQLARLAASAETLAAEERRVSAALAQVQTRLAQLAGDIERETRLASDAAEALRRLDTEAGALAAAEAGANALESAAAAVLADADGALGIAEAALGEITANVAAVEAERAALARAISEAEARRARLTGEAAEVSREKTSVEAAANESGSDRAVEAVRLAEAALTAARVAAEDAAVARDGAEKARDSARAAAQNAETPAAQLAAEIRALTEILDPGPAGEFPGLLDRLSVDAGYEGALGVALGDDLNAATDEAAPMFWRALPPLPEAQTLPAGVESLARFVRAPGALDRRLSQIGVVPDRVDGAALWPSLRPGQRLVTRAGALWRWDGFAIAAGAPTAAAMRLAQRNRLSALQEARSGAESSANAARQTLADAEAAAQMAASRDGEARRKMAQALADLAAAKEAEAELARRGAANLARLAVLAAAGERIAADLAEVERRLETSRTALAEAQDPVMLRARLAQAKAATIEARRVYGERRDILDRMRRETAARQARLAAIENEKSAWRERESASARQLAALGERRQAEQDDRQVLAERPAAILAERRILFDHTQTAEGARRLAADRLAEAETRVAETERRLKAIEAKLIEAREDRVRVESALAQARQAREALAARIRERLDVSPEIAAEIADIEPGEERGIGQAEIRLDRLLKERDGMGPVNLRAEQEAAELEVQIGSLQSEKADLLTAIARLRQGISSLSREGRERLVLAFEAVNRHFQDLFARLFGGGRAHLMLTEAEDPLDAGLEVMASPPGKRPRVLSLLSGGEQALTALSLLFAVFLANPAPICVLDEVDAPLDDANVDRFCTMLDEISRATRTRFLLITHHRLTMVRMDRLYGVTMVERGISQLVSVDLRAGEQVHLRAAE